jgi:hypothetical protein
LLLLLLAGIELAAAAPPDPHAPDNEAEVIVKSRREKLSELKPQIIKLENQIYSDYNRLNPDHQYDIICTTGAPTDSHLQNRMCLPAFVRSAREAEAANLLSQFNLDGHPAPPASMVVLAKRQSFKENYRHVIHAHPELLKLDREYGDLVKRYDDAARK